VTRIGVRIQHHPSRAELLPLLLKNLKGLTTEVVTHESDPPSPWAGYQRCLTDIPHDLTHLLIVQDDTVPSPGFVKAVRQIAKAHPDAPVCLFLGRLPRDASIEARRALADDRRYVRMPWRSFMPIVAVLWPRHKAVEFIEWTQTNAVMPGIRGEPRSDDAVAGRWKSVTRQTVLACVPSIIEHPDEADSTIGKRSRHSKAAARVAAFIAEDASAYDWSKT
jgi:hypothetical protein